LVHLLGNGLAIKSEDHAIVEESSATKETEAKKLYVGVYATGAGQPAFLPRMPLKTIKIIVYLKCPK
jgi:hypothetical protein